MMNESHHRKFVNACRSGAVLLTFIYAICTPPVFAQPSEDDLNRVCPADKHRVRSKLERFVFQVSGREPTWAEEVPGLAFLEGRHDIQVLVDEADAEVCEALNRRYSDFITETSTWPDQETPYRKYDVVFYKGDAYYFAVIAHAPVPQPDDPFQRSWMTGRDEIAVYDQNLKPLLEILR